MSKLKNTFGLPESLIDAIKQIHETSHLSPKQKKIAKLAGDPNKIDAEDLATLRRTQKESIENLDEISTKTLISYVKKAKDSLKPDEVFPKREEGIQKAIQKASDKFSPSLVSRMLSTKKNEAYESDLNHLIEGPGTYPFKANEIAPFVSQLKALLQFLAKTPSLKKLMRDETGIDLAGGLALVEFIEIFDQQLRLNEAKKQNEDEEDEEDKEESGSQNPMTGLRGISDLDTHGQIETNKGPKLVKSADAKHASNLLLSLKPEARAKHIDDITNWNTDNPIVNRLQNSHNDLVQRGEKTTTKSKPGRKKKSVD